MIKRTFRHKKFLLLLFLFYSCVEHNFFVEVQPEGDFVIDYKAHGDRSDLLDSDFPVPKGESWDIVSTLDIEDSETYDYSATRRFTKNEVIPDTFYEGDSILTAALLKTPIHVVSKNWILKKTFNFNCIFEGRGIQTKYPLMKSLFNEEEDSEGWLKELLSYLLFETLERSEVGFNLEPVIQADLENWIDENLTLFPDSLLLDSLEVLKLDGLDVLRRPVSPEFYPKMDSIFKVLEDEASITIDLADDDFEYRIILPGALIETNADTTRGDTIIWHFNLKQYQDDDFEMFARSEIIYQIRYRMAIVLILVLLISVSAYVWIKSRKKENNDQEGKS